MLFEITNRFTGSVQFSCELDVSFESQSYGVRLGAAVKIAIGSHADLTRANLAGANLSRATLVDANLAGANLADANLAGANLSRATLVDANLADANLAGACLAGAYLAGANLAGANLAGAYLAGANLADANLAGACLAGAYLAGANLAGAYLAGANLADAKWTDALILSMPPIQVGGLTYFCHGINGTHLQIGCRLHTVAEWERFDDAAIVAMDGNRALEFWRQWKEPLLSIVRGMAKQEEAEAEGADRGVENTDAAKETSLPSDDVVVISMDGGIVCQVFCKPGTKVWLIDWDDECCEDDDRIVEINQEGEAAYCVEFPADPIEALKGTDCELAIQARLAQG